MQSEILSTPPVCICRSNTTEGALAHACTVCASLDREGCCISRRGERVLCKC